MKLMSRYVNGNTQKISVNTADEANELNQFFNHLDCCDFSDFSRKHSQIHVVLNGASAADDDFQRFHTSENEVGRAFQHVNSKKASGADNITPRVLKVLHYV